MNIWSTDHNNHDNIISFDDILFGRNTTILIENICGLNIWYFIKFLLMIFFTTIYFNSNTVILNEFKTI